MNKRYVKSEKGYEKTSLLDEKKIVEAMKRLKTKKKVPTANPRTEPSYTGERLTVLCSSSLAPCLFAFWRRPKKMNITISTK